MDFQSHSQIHKFYKLEVSTLDVKGPVPLTESQGESLWVRLQGYEFMSLSVATGLCQSVCLWLQAYVSLSFCGYRLTLVCLSVATGLHQSVCLWLQAYVSLSV